MPQSHLRTPVETRSGPVIVGERIATFSDGYVSPLVEISRVRQFVARARFGLTNLRCDEGDAWATSCPPYDCITTRPHHAARKYWLFLEMTAELGLRAHLT